MEKEQDGVHDVAWYFKQFKKIQGECKGRIIFRGIDNQKYDVVSSAGRRLSKESDKQNDFIRYHVKLLANARKNGYGGLNAGSKLSDLEVLAEIQHYGGATCLTDFTTNFLVALWFATKQNSDEENENKKNKDLLEKTGGKLVWLDLGEEINFNSISYYNENIGFDKIQNILSHITSNFESKERTVESCFWLWEPTKLNNRIIKQDSVFLFGLPAFTYKDFESGEIKNRLTVKELIIETKDKKYIRTELEKFLGINAESVFYDFSGYALNANGTSIPVSNNILSEKECLSLAKENIKRRELSLTISYLDEAIECFRSNKKNSYQKKCKRGRATPCSCSLGELMFWRGRANEGKSYVEEALLNYYESSRHLKDEITNHENNKKLYKLLCESYRKQSILYYQKRDYKGAVNSNLELWKLYNQNYNLKDIDKDDNGVDSIFALLELSLMRLNQSDFDKYLHLAEKIKVENTNGEILLFYLKTLGNIIFSMKIDSIDTTLKSIDDKVQMIISQMGKNGISIIGYYYWNYDDIIGWIENILLDNKIVYFQNKEILDLAHYKKFIAEHSKELILLTKKVYEGQNKLLNSMRSKSVAFRDELLLAPQSPNYYY